MLLTSIVHGPKVIIVFKCKLIHTHTHTHAEIPLNHVPFTSNFLTFVSGLQAFRWPHWSVYSPLTSLFRFAYKSKRGQQEANLLTSQHGGNRLAFEDHIVPITAAQLCLPARRHMDTMRVSECGGIPTRLHWWPTESELHSFLCVGITVVFNSL